MDYHFIYLIKDKQDIDSGASIYKIGKSTQENTKRVKSYPSGSYLLLQVACNDCHGMETYLIKEFKKLFILARGREYFEGNLFKMINLIFFIVQSEINVHKVEYMMTDNHNLSLVVNYNNDLISYSFNNKDNILDEYNRDLIANERKYKHLEIKHNGYIHETGETIQALEVYIKELKKENESLQDLTKGSIDEVHEQTKYSKLNDSYNELYNQFVTEQKNLSSLLLIKNELYTVYVNLQEEYNKVSNLYLVNTNLLKTTMINNDTLNKNFTASQTDITTIKKNMNGLLGKHNSLLNENLLLKSDHKLPNRLYNGLFAYMLYGIMYHIYIEPYTITNWLLLTGSSYFIYAKKPLTHPQPPSD